MSQAVAFYSEGQSGYREKKSIRDVAHEFSVDPSTLSRHIRGKGMSMLEFNQKKQKLTVMEENVLVTFILEDQIAIIESCNVMSHLYQGGVNVTIWLPAFFPLVYEIIYGVP